jgi:hypothetical protein
VNVIDDTCAESVDPHAVNASADDTTARPVKKSYVAQRRGAAADFFTSPAALNGVRNRSIRFGIQSPGRRCRDGHPVYLAWMLRR